MRRLITWGTGELGGRVAKLWRAQGGAVVGVTQTEQRHADLIALGVEPRTDSPATFLHPADALLFALPGHATQSAAIEQIATLPPPARTVLISSTGYYGLPNGVINEDTPSGAGTRPQAIAAVEQAFLNWAGPNGVVIRFGGLYRPGRGPMSALARRGHPPPGPANKTLALIHYDDAATATATALQRPSPAQVYLGVMPPCPTRAAFYHLACAALDLPPATFSEPLPFPSAKFDATRLRQDLLPKPLFPDWQAALQM